MPFQFFLADVDNKVKCEEGRGEEADGRWKNIDEATILPSDRNTTKNLPTRGTLQYTQGEVELAEKFIIISAKVFSLHGRGTIQ